MIDSLIEYKGYHAEIEFNKDENIFVGHVLKIKDSVNFHGKTMDELNEAFHNAIDNYLARIAQAESST